MSSLDRLAYLGGYLVHAQGGLEWFLSGCYFHVPLRPGTGLGQLDLHVIAQADDEAEQPVGRESIEAASEQFGNLGLADAELSGTVYLHQPPQQHAAIPLRIVVAVNYYHTHSITSFYYDIKVH